MTDPRWGMLEAARPELVREFSSRGVIKVEFFAAFPQVDGIAVWLCTATDEQRDALGVPNPGLTEVRSVLLDVGFTADQIGQVVTISQSQETVDRDYTSSWFYAMR